MKATSKVLAGCVCLSLLQVALAAAPQETDQFAKGRQVFQKWCAGCHDAGRDYPGTVALEAKYRGALPAPLEQRTDLTPDTIRYFVRHGVSIMPFFRKTEVSDADLEALTNYLAKPKKLSKTSAQRHSIFR